MIPVPVEKSLRCFAQTCVSVLDVKNTSEDATIEADVYEDDDDDDGDDDDDEDV